MRGRGRGRGRGQSRAPARAPARAQRHCRACGLSLANHPGPYGIGKCAWKAKEFGSFVAAGGRADPQGTPGHPGSPEDLLDKSEDWGSQWITVSQYGNIGGDISDWDEESQQPQTSPRASRASARSTRNGSRSGSGSFSPPRDRRRDPRAPPGGFGKPSRGGSSNHPGIQAHHPGSQAPKVSSHVQNSPFWSCNDKDVDYEYWDRHNRQHDELYDKLYPRHDSTRYDGSPRECGTEFQNNVESDLTDREIRGLSDEVGTLTARLAEIKIQLTKKAIREDPTHPPPARPDRHPPPNLMGCR